MILYLIILAVIFISISKDKRHDGFDYFVAWVLFSVMFFLYSLFHSAVGGHKTHETTPLTVSSISVNSPEYWIFTDDGGVYTAHNPKLSEEPSSYTKYSYPQRWWYLNLPCEEYSYNLNIDDLYNKRVSGNSSK
jgi:hypothetical protein